MNFKIDYIINEWAKDKLLDNERINKLIKIGYFIEKEFNFEINPLKNEFSLIKNDINKYNDSLVDLKSTIDNLRGITKTSSSKGKLMENFIEDVIKENFEDDTLEIVSKIGHESDMHLHFNNNNNISILIEVKAYTDVVPSKEIDKFYKDMDRIGYKGGIFISVSSGIVGFKRFDIRKTNNNIMIFLPSVGINPTAIIWSILFLKQYLEFDYKNLEDNTAAALYDNFINNITHIYYEFENEYNNISKLRYDIKMSKGKIDDVLDGIYRQTLDLEIRMKSILESSKSKIWSNLLELYNINNENEIDKTSLDEYLEIIRDKNDKNLESWINIKDILNKYNLIIHKEPNKTIDESKIYFIYNNTHINIFKIKKFKEKLECIFTNPNITLEPKDFGLNILNSILEIN
jgi:hypothetical protein